MQNSSWRRALHLVALASVYVVAGKLGLALAFANPSATPVWAPTGIALAAFLTLGLRVWPAIFVGAFLVNLTTAGTVLTSLGIATGNTLEGVVGALLVNRWAGGQQAFDHARNLFRFAALAGAVATAVSATLGVTTLALAGYADWATFDTVWLTWWLGDAAGALIVAPPLLLWARTPPDPRPATRTTEVLALAATVAATGLLIFTNLSPFTRQHSPLEFLAMPVVLWAAFRFGPRGTTTVVLALSGIAIGGTLQGFGPFVGDTPNESLVLVQTFLGIAAVTGLGVAATITERTAMEQQLRQWSITDPLTGLANYRQLVTAVESEIRRYNRTERPFALLVLDLDDLKGINDRLGHLVGSRALCRLADALRHCCRALDTAARFGGDEFVVVLPETGEGEARRLADRIAARMTADREAPPISASMGVAVYPRDGTTVESLIGQADALLYAAKRARAG